MTLNLQYNTIIEMHTGGIKHLTVCTGGSCPPNSRLLLCKKYEASTLKGRYLQGAPPHLCYI